jgi:succinate-semialdehyde dehydrogenase/glutarate-semialdehyde dehydrogenase
LGGKRLDRPGYILEPTILTNIKPENPAYYQEFFAPVALIFRVKDENEAIKLANDSPYGLGGSVITKGYRARQASCALDRNGHGLYQQSNLDRT